MKIWNKSWTWFDNIMNILSLGGTGSINKLYSGDASSSEGLLEHFGKMISGDTSGNGVADNLFNKYTESDLTGAQKAQNQFNHDEAALAYQRQIDFYNQYQSPQAQVQQYQDAGLNPALMYNKGAAAPSAMSAPQASGSNASSGDAISAILSMISMKQQVENWKVDRKLKSSEADNVKAQSDLYAQQAQYYETMTGLNKLKYSKDIEEADSRILVNLAQASLHEANISTSEALSDLYGYQATLALIDTDTRAALNTARLEAEQSLRRLQDSKADRESEEYRQLSDSYEANMSKFLAIAQEATSRANITAKEDRYWATEKGIEAILISSQTFNNYKMKEGPLTMPGGLRQGYNPVGFGMQNPYTTLEEGPYHGIDIPTFHMPKWSFRH